MTIKKLIIEATIPTVQYGNVKPTIELEGGSFDEMRDEGLKAIQSISDMSAGEGYGFKVRGLPVNSGRTTMVVEDDGKDFTSSLLGKTTKVKESNGHKYLTGYKGGSSFPSRFYAPFDSKMILDAIIKKFPGVSAPDILAMWKLNNEASTGYGSAVHAALENFDKNKALGQTIRGVEKKATKKTLEVLTANKALSKNPFLRALVNWFQEIAGDDSVILTEEFIWDDVLKNCGSMDRVKIVDIGTKILRIQDYKTDGNIHEKKYQLPTSPFYPLTQGDTPKMGKELLDYHWLQLSFYANILQRAGWTVEGLDVFWLNPEKLVSGNNPWEVFSHDVIDISKAL